jgi:hypothetical protein
MKTTLRSSKAILSSSGDFQTKSDLFLMLSFTWNSWLEKNKRLVIKEDV